MAGDYIPFDHDFPEKTEVVTLSQDTGVTIAEIMLRFHKFWRHFDRHVGDKFAPGLREKGVAILCGGDEDFWHHVELMGWAIFRDGGCEMPGFAARLDKGKGCAYKRMRTPEQLREKAAERQRRKRARDKGVTGGVTGGVTDPVTPPVTLRPQNQNQNQNQNQLPVTSYQEPVTTIHIPDPNGGSAALHLSPGGRHDELRTAWNAVPKYGNLPGLTACREMTGKRMAAHCARLKSSGWTWQEALQRLAESEFCQGGGKDGWRADIDWFLRPDTVARILEGKYDNRELPGNTDPHGNLATLARIERSIHERHEHDRAG